VKPSKEESAVMTHRVLKGTGLALVALALATAAHAAANANGTLIVHAQPEIAYCSDTPSYCGSATLADCALAQIRVDGPATTVFFVFASFPDGSSPSLVGVTFGVRYSNAISLVGHGPCGDFELAESGWPASDTGTAVTWNTPQQTQLVPVYWFAGYNYDSPNPALFSTTPHETQGGVFADDHIPALVDEIQNYGALGFDQDGIDGCDPVLPPGMGACCFADHNCVPFMNGEECVAQGGLYLGDLSECSACGYDIPGACCVPDVGCQLISQYDCAVLHGVFYEYQANCSTGLCSAVGACCLISGECQFTYEEACLQIPQAVFMADVPCDPNPCVPDGGACCFPWGECGFTTQSTCDANQGVFMGVGTDCTPDPCHGPYGACCRTSGVCVVVNSEECAQQNGTFQGEGTECTPNPCAQPGACCMPDGSCDVRPESSCQGEWMGESTTCDPDPCTPSGACCLTNGHCIVTTEDDCPGSWAGPGTICDQVPCSPVPIEPSTWGRIKSRFR